jgi:hypothetical protein
MMNRHPALGGFQLTDLTSGDVGSGSDCDGFLEPDWVFPEELSYPQVSATPILYCPSVIHQRVRKGDGAESKKKSPDQYDQYHYKAKSVAYARITALGYRTISLVQIVRIGGFVENWLQAAHMPMSERNRAARRRKPNAFHWIDENWQWMRLVPFDGIVMTVLGLAPFGRRGTTKH